MYAVELLPSAARELSRLEASVQRRIGHAIDHLAEEPRPPGAAKLRGADAVWRLRVGDYRILYVIEDPRLLIVVVKIGHRREVYR